MSSSEKAKTAKNNRRQNWQQTVREALLAYVLDKTRAFPKSKRNQCLFWANY